MNQQPNPITPDDLWANRADRMRCKTCIYFVRKLEDGTPHTKRLVDMGVGRCRRHAPTMNGFPVVFVNDWCGDHKIDEGKL